MVNRTDNSKAFEGRIAQTNAILKRSRSIYYSLIFANVYALIGLFGIEDSDFFLIDHKVNLPFISSEVSPILFCSVAPLLLIITYMYQHYYLLNLLGRLNELPVRFRNGTMLSERIEPWIVSLWSIRRRIGTGNNESGASRVENTVIIASLSIATLFTPITVSLFWYHSFAPHSKLLSFSLAFVLAVSVLTFVESAIFTTARETPKKVAYMAPVLLFCVLAFISYGRVVGFPDKWVTTGSFPKLYSAQLDNLFLDKKPITWQNHQRFLQNFLQKKLGYVKAWRASKCMITESERPHDCIGKERGLNHDDWNLLIKILGRERQNYINSLHAASLENHDLRRASLRNAFLANVNASGTNFSGAKLDRANLEGSNLAKANFSDARLSRANLAGANLAETCFFRADLSFVNARNTNISYANFDLTHVYGTDFSGFFTTGWDPNKIGIKLFMNAFGDKATRIHSNRMDIDTPIPYKEWGWPNLELSGAGLDNFYKPWKTSKEKNSSIVSCNRRTNQDD